MSYAFDAMHPRDGQTGRFVFAVPQAPRGGLLALASDELEEIQRYNDRAKGGSPTPESAEQVLHYWSNQTVKPTAHTARVLYRNEIVGPYRYQLQHGGELPVVQVKKPIADMDAKELENLDRLTKIMTDLSELPEDEVERAMAMRFELTFGNEKTLAEFCNDYDVFFRMYPTKEFQGFTVTQDEINAYPPNHPEWFKGATASEVISYQDEEYDIINGTPSMGWRTHLQLQKKHVRRRKTIARLLTLFGIKY